MKKSSWKFVIILVFGLALLGGVGYLIMKKVEQWVVAYATKEVVTQGVEKETGFLKGFGRD